VCAVRPLASQATGDLHSKLSKDDA
jgi:hypothetical protein